MIVPRAARMRRPEPAWGRPPGTGGGVGAGVSLIAGPRGARTGVSSGGGPPGRPKPPSVPRTSRGSSLRARHSAAPATASASSAAASTARAGRGHQRPA